jgi:hypothetical protein
VLQLAAAAAASAGVVVVVVWGCGWEGDEWCPEDLRMCSKITNWKFRKLLFCHNRFKIFKPNKRKYSN